MCETFVAVAGRVKGGANANLWRCLNRRVGAKSAGIKTEAS
jgi:hypothetical protein